MGGTSIPYNHIKDRLLFFSDVSGVELEYLARNIRFGFAVRLDSDFNIRMEELDLSNYDPSTIFVHLPIAEPSGPNPLSYWPSYAQMSPDQRHIYLNWLKDIRQDIDTGYVFVYYYGLERHLLSGEFERAFDEIITLKKYCENKSFQNYSTTALIYACLINKRPDKLLELNAMTEMEGFRNVQFECAYHFNFDLGPKNLIQIFRKISKKAYRPIKDNKDLLEQCVSDLLLEEYSKPSYPFGKNFNIEKVRVKEEQAFANYSFPAEVRFIPTHNFYGYRKFMNELNRLFERAYEQYKVKKKKNK